MPFTANYDPAGPSREEIDRTTGLVLLEFGTDWCPICQAVQPALKSALEAHPEVQHIKVEDGSGRPLGRSFRVKLWPNLVLLKDGQMVEQLVRPAPRDIEPALRRLKQLAV